MESFGWLPSEIGLFAALILIGVSSVTSFITAAFGIGGGVMLIAVMTQFVPATALIPVHGLVQLGSNVGRALLLWRYCQWEKVWPFALGTILGVALGTLFFVQIPDWAVQLGIGLFVLWSALGRLPNLGTKSVMVSGAISSGLSMFFGATGPFVAALVKTFGFDPLHYSATHAMMMTLQHGLKVVGFIMIGAALAPYIPLIIAMIASGFVGTVLGKRILKRQGPRYFQTVFTIILVLLSFRLILQGLGNAFGVDVW